jgi:hypothetical protein
VEDHSGIIERVKELTGGQFCERVIASAEARAVVNAARAADRLLAVDLSYRFTEGMGRIRELLAAAGSAESMRSISSSTTPTAPTKPGSTIPLCPAAAA